MATFRIITFPSTHDAMAAEDALHEAKVELEVVPAPKEISAGCGLALRVRARDLGRAEDVLRFSELRYGKIVEAERD